MEFIGTVLEMWVHFINSFKESILIVFIVATFLCSYLIYRYEKYQNFTIAICIGFLCGLLSTLCYLVAPIVAAIGIFIVLVYLFCKILQKNGI